MIQATFTGTVYGHYKYLPATSDDRPLVSFSVYAGPGYSMNRNRVRCRLRGNKARLLYRSLTPGKRVVLSGLIRLVEAEHPFLACEVATLEILPENHQPTDDDEEHDDAV